MQFITTFVDNYIDIYVERAGNYPTRLELDRLSYKCLYEENNGWGTCICTLPDGVITYKGIPIVVVYTNEVHVRLTNNSEGSITTKLESSR